MLTSMTLKRCAEQSKRCIDPFKSIPGFFTLPESSLAGLADQLSLISEGSSLTHVNQYTYRNSDVMLSSERVSRRHARVYGDGGGGFWVADLGSRHGTSLNGERFRDDARRLQSGDTISFEDMEKGGDGAPFGKNNKGKLKFDGDNLTITGDDGSLKLSRVK